jgi:two-component system sensor histidine kinase/response regulator
MNDHLGKPFDLQRLCEVILRHTGPGGVPAADGTAPPVLPALPAASPAPLAPAAALARMDGSQPVYLRALRSFADELDRFEADADAACARADAAALMACCHTIKGVSATVGADEMAAASGAAEAALRGGAAAATVDRHALRQVAARARAAARQHIGPESAPKPAPDSAPEDGAFADLPAALERLQQQLLASNLAALTTFESVRATLVRHAPEPCAALAAAIGQLQFSRAATLCGQLRADRLIEREHDKV